MINYSQNSSKKASSDLHCTVALTSEHVNSATEKLKLIQTVGVNELKTYLAFKRERIIIIIIIITDIS